MPVDQVTIPHPPWHRPGRACCSGCCAARRCRSSGARSFVGQSLGARQSSAWRRGRRRRRPPSRAVSAAARHVAEQPQHDRADHRGAAEDQADHQAHGRVWRLSPSASRMALSSGVPRRLPPSWLHGAPDRHRGVSGGRSAAGRISTVLPGMGDGAGLHAVHGGDLPGGRASAMGIAGKQAARYPGRRDRRACRWPALISTGRAGRTSPVRRPRTASMRSIAIPRFALCLAAARLRQRYGGVDRSCRRLPRRTATILRAPTTAMRPACRRRRPVRGAYGAPCPDLARRQRGQGHRQRLHRDGLPRTWAAAPSAVPA